MSQARIRSPKSRSRSARSGAAAVEFAITAPILFLILFAALELGRMNMIRQTAANAAYEAVRTCAVPGATNAEGVSAATSILESIGVSNYTVSVTPATILDNTSSVSASVVVPYSVNMWVPPVFSQTGSANVSCSMARDWVVSTRLNTD